MHSLIKSIFLLTLAMGLGANAARGQTQESCEARIPISSLPFHIDQSGSYYLTGDLWTEGTGIILDPHSSDSTIDLNGFTIHGNQQNDAIGTSLIPVFRVKIFNGKIANVRNGIVIDGSGITIENVSIIGEDGYGIQIQGNLNRIQNCEVQGFRYGIDSGSLSHIRGNIVSGNSQWGIRASGGSLVLENSASNNGIGILALEGCLIRNNNSNWNTQVGISLLKSGSSSQPGSTAIDNKCSGNLEIGLETNSPNNSILENSISLSPVGFHGQPGTKRNILDGNRIMNCSTGFLVEAQGNQIIRNQTLGCLKPYRILHGNDRGPIGNAKSSKSPWANLNF